MRKFFVVFERSGQVASNGGIDLPLHGDDRSYPRILHAAVRPVHPRRLQGARLNPKLRQPCRGGAPATVH